MIKSSSRIHDSMVIETVHVQSGGYTTSNTGLYKLKYNYVFWFIHVYAHGYMYIHIIT